MGLLRRTGATEGWDETTQTPHFAFSLPRSSSNRTLERHEIWYENAVSLGLKYAFAKEAGVQGVAMWTANAIDNSNATQVGAFWGAVRQFVPG